MYATGRALQLLTIGSQQDAHDWAVSFTSLFQRSFPIGHCWKRSSKFSQLRDETLLVFVLPLGDLFEQPRRQGVLIG